MDHIKIIHSPPTVPTTAAAFHESATHVDALGMPVAFVWHEGDENPWSYHPTPCCGASATFSETTLCCKKCWHEVDLAYGNVPLEPLQVLEGRAIPERPAPIVFVELYTYQSAERSAEDIAAGRYRLDPMSEGQSALHTAEITSSSVRDEDGITHVSVDEREIEKAREVLKAIAFTATGL